MLTSQLAEPMEERLVETLIHGRYLYEARGDTHLLAGFHGYAERAETHLEQLHSVQGTAGWSIAAIQALHPFYLRSGEIVANWMTSLHREHAIADNLAYIRRIVDAIPHETLVFVGFSQGASMAARAAAFAAPCAGLILLGGDIPRDVKDDPEVRLPPVLVGRGSTDTWYTAEKFNEDLSFLESHTRVTAVPFEGGHEWTDVFREAMTEFLNGLTERRRPGG